MRIHASGGVSIGDTTDPGAGSLRVAGNTTFGDASTDTVTVNGYMGVGVAPQANYGMNVRHSALSGTDIAGVLSVPTASASHATARAHYGRVDTPVSAFTVGRTAVFEALDGTKGAGSTITNQNGVYIPDLTVGTNNYGITSAVAASPVSRTITNVQVTSNVVTVTTSVAHGLMIGETPTVTATTNTGINGAALITGTPTTTTFTYAKTLADIASVADTGTVALTRNKWNIYASGSAPNYFAGNVLVGATTTQRPIEIAGAGSAGSINALHVEGTGSNYSGATFVRNDPTTAVLGSTINLGRTRGANAGDVTVVQNGDTLGGIAFFGADGTDIRTNAAHILAQVDGTPGANDMPGRLIFATTADGAAVPTERMRIDAAGNVGIGTAAPNFLGTGTALTVLGSATNRALVELGSTTATASGVFAQLSGYNGSATLASAIQFAGGGLSDSGDIRLFTKTSGSGIVERMRLDSAGNVGVGTNNPGTKLHVSSAGTVISKVENTTAGIVIQSGADSSVGFIGTYTNHPFVISTNSAERMRIDSAGNLGLGVTTLSPWAGGNSAIQLGGSSHLAGTSSLTQSVNYYYDGANKYVGAGAASRYVQSAGAHTWSTATSVGSAAGNPIAWVQQMTLDASGNVGVGVAPSAWKSNYTAIEQKYGISLVATDSAHATLTQNCYIDSAGGWIHKAPGPSTAMAMQLTNAQGFKVYEAAAAVAGTAATMVQTLAVQKDKTLALQGATSQTGAGLSFPATQVASTDANTLDDYEEGTWTPGITFGGSSVGVTFGGANGIYTKIGRVVYIAGLITLTSKGGLSGAALINGLPFTVGNSLVGTSIAGVMGALCLSGGTSVSDFELCPIASTATITPYNYTGGAATQIVAADITDAWAIRFSGYYAV